MQKKYKAASNVLSTHHMFMMTGSLVFIRSFTVLRGWLSGTAADEIFRFKACLVTSAFNKASMSASSPLLDRKFEGST